MRTFNTLTSRRLSQLAVALGCSGSLWLGFAQPAGAQVQTFMLKPGSKVGPATEVKATDCVTKPDGTISCNTKLVNPPGDTPAKPMYSPFKN